MRKKQVKQARSKQNKQEQAKKNKLKARKQNTQSIYQAGASKNRARKEKQARPSGTKQKASK